MASSVNNSEPQVSVITPFLNGAGWLKEAVESVLAQTYTNWELILINDGSKEEATSVAIDYAERFPGKIICLEHEGKKNRGVTASRNLGIKNSTGSLIAFLDSDDCWLADKLRVQVEKFQQYPETGMLCEASKYWFSWEKPGQTDIVIKVGASEGYYEPPKLVYILYPLGKGAAPCPSGMIMTRDAFIRSGGFEEGFIGANQVYEDQAFLFKIYLKENVYLSEAVNNLYRQRAGSLMESIGQRKQYFRVRRFFIGWLENYLRQHSVHDSKINSLIRKAKFETDYTSLYNFLGKIKKLIS